MHFSILFHPNKPDSPKLAEEIARWLKGKDHTSWIGNTFNESEVHEESEKSDLMIVLGGDGSILRAARFAVPYDTPIFGINMGRIGFLSETDPEHWPDVLEQFLQDKYWTESRLMLRAKVVRRQQELGDYIALNDFVIGGIQARVVRLKLSVDGEEITTYTADSVIVATPTGSTAYSMAAGGPLLPPVLNNFLLMPVAPYLSLDRALVLHQKAEAHIQVRTDHGAILTVDGQEPIDLVNDDKIIITRHDHTARFARVGERSYFYRRLFKRLGFER
ncbi:MAG: NAD(+)/NADH kinase [Chloroflexota bacterium]